jgi:hypothetical protein
MAKKKSRPPTPGRVQGNSHAKAPQLGTFGMLILDNDELTKWAAELKTGAPRQTTTQPNSPFAPFKKAEPTTRPTSRPNTTPHVRAGLASTAIQQTSASDHRETKRPSLKAAAGAVRPPSLRGQPAVDFVMKQLEGVRFAIDDTDSLEETEDIADCVELGAAEFRSDGRSDVEGYNVGFDFGSSASKVVFHRPFLGDGQDTIPLLVPRGLRATGQPFCWQTAVWYDIADHTFSLAPSDGAIKLTGFKSAIVLKQGHRIADSTGRACSVTYLDAAIAYLTLMIAYAIGNYAQHGYLGPRVANKFRAIFLSYPKAHGVSSGFETQFAIAFRAAFMLIGDANNLRQGDIDAAKEMASAPDLAKFPSQEHASPYYARTELEGVIAGYDATSEARDGGHLVIDVGATTLDIAFVRYLNEEGTRHGVVYSTAVVALGAQSYEWFTKSQASPNDEVFQAAVTQVFTLTAANARSYDTAFNRTLSKSPIPVILCGGGRHCALHQRLFKRQGAETYWGSPVRTPLPNLNIDINEPYDPGRLLVAWGLARDFADFPSIRLADKSDALEVDKHDITDRYIGAELT